MLVASKLMWPTAFPTQRGGGDVGRNKSKSKDLTHGVGPEVWVDGGRRCVWGMGGGLVKAQTNVEQPRKTRHSQEEKEEWKEKERLMTCLLLFVISSFSNNTNKKGKKRQVQSLPKLF